MTGKPLRTKAHISLSGLKARLELVVSGCGLGSRLLHDAHRMCRWLRGALSHFCCYCVWFCHVRYTKPLRRLAVGVKQDLTSDVEIPSVSFEIRCLIYGEPPEDEGWGREWIYKLALNTAKGKTPITTTETTPIALAERRSVDKTATAPSENVLSRGAMSHPRRGGSIWRGR
ncbi:hypothetical protein BHE74_00013461 [Ensete ventricosum]|nr:hypothetical protein BHE74_00013461 [Ensete ventricosum]